MADNVAFTPGEGATAAADLIGSVYYARVKLSIGADGSATDAEGGAGTNGSGVQRVTLATDDAASVALAVMDDWDESDRAKVNLVVGQAGISAGAGAVAANTPRVTHASDDPAVTALGNINTSASTIATKTTALANAVAGEYETVAASQTAQVLGATGAAGDFISHVLVVPASTSPGAVTLLDNATSITVFAGGSSSVSSLVPFVIPLNMVSVSGAWKLTTGSSVSCIAVGSFT